MKPRKSQKPEFPSGQVYWTRFALAIVAAVVSFASRLGLVGLLIGALVYALSFPVMILVFHIRWTGNGHPFYTLGLGSYVFLWLTLWTLLNTFFPNLLPQA